MSELNGVMMQFFHWYTEADGSLWTELIAEAKALADIGITSLWLPPAYKGSAGGYDVGYGVYDRYDLGEFDQKGSIRTKYGTKDEYIRAIAAAHQAGLQVYADIVINDMMGADESEEAEAIPLNPDNRNEVIGDLQPVTVWTHFTFPGRHGTYSKDEWHWWHFTAVDHKVENESQNAIYRFKGKEFDRDVDLEKGSFDYLMGCDLDVNNPEVADRLNKWGDWYIETTKIDGFRFDAVKHVKAGFFPHWLKHCRKLSDRSLFAVGEYWSSETEALHHFIDATGGNVMLFDAPLHYNFTRASKTGNKYDMRQIFDDTLVRQQPTLAVTLVDNHDSQPLQALESVVESWFKPLAYALILLRRDGYPCIFYADYYGAHYRDNGHDGHNYEIWMDSHRVLIDIFLAARRSYAHGDQFDYFNHANTIGWTRQGDDEHPGGLAVVLSNGDSGRKWMQIARSPNQKFVDLTQQIGEPLTTNAEGWAEFHCNAGSVSVWGPVELN
jgi:alpha-amylase